MKKTIEPKIIMKVYLIVGIIGYSYIMIFRTPGLLEVLALILFTLFIRFSSGYCLNKNYNGVKIRDYINKQYNGFLKVLYLLFPIVITLLMFFGMNRGS